jgi:anaerobic selenocysteine-containing dehydrogenase
MAECHPVGFQWVMEAKARGAKVIHVDPRFTRTSAVADLHVPLRAGSSVGWTQHTVGAQYIRTAATLQLLLGNIGRPGGGILALRGHASIQGSTDIPTLFDLLPGHLPMPHVHGNEDLAAYVAAESMDKGFWADMGSYLVSLLKSWWGDAATPANDFCFDYLPRLTGSHSTYETVVAQIEGNCQGYFLFGENPAVGSANGRMQRFGLANLDWLVVRDLVMIESATFWQNGPEIETGEMRTADIGTEVFFLPAAAHTEKNGSFTNTQRMLQWHHEAVEPAADDGRHPPARRVPDRGRAGGRGARAAQPGRFRAGRRVAGGGLGDDQVRDLRGGHGIGQGPEVHDRATAPPCGPSAGSGLTPPPPLGRPPK